MLGLRLSRRRAIGRFFSVFFTRFPMCAHDHRPQDFTRYRHRWEMPLIRLCALVSIGVLILGPGVYSADEGRC
jgi:hypothetical protein